MLPVKQGDRFRARVSVHGVSAGVEVESNTGHRLEDCYYTQRVGLIRRRTQIIRYCGNKLRICESGSGKIRCQKA